MSTLSALEPTCGVEAALAFYDSLPGVRSVEVTGRWRGRELATGHSMDGLLAASGWYGKQFDDVDTVHPLLFGEPGGRIVSLDPRRIPLGMAGRVPAATLARGSRLFAAARPAMRTRKPRARLRDIEHRGVVTAAMVYDHLPIIDVFRRVDDDTLLGVMDLRQHPRPYFFILARD